jgi:hypothetical protein
LYDPTPFALHSTTQFCQENGNINRQNKFTQNQILGQDLHQVWKLVLDNGCCKLNKNGYPKYKPKLNGQDFKINLI